VHGGRTGERNDARWTNKSDVKGIWRKRRKEKNIR